MLYNALKNLIVNNRYEKEDMKNKLDIFLNLDRITLEQYTELYALANPEINIPAEEPIEGETP
ncbi:hypothetical protein GCM10008905_02730 [Clostridium malenominatum]|uniref:XkdX family protein n=1 Tax=Clostridium malenominatum TaxID=1539 RepID=A0ABN1IM45_9CLOT